MLKTTKHIYRFQPRHCINTLYFCVLGNKSTKVSLATLGASWTPAKINPLNFIKDFSRPVPFFTSHSTQMDFCSSWTRRGLNRSRKNDCDVAWSSSQDCLQSKLGCVFGFLSHKAQSVSTLGILHFSQENNLTSDSINRSHWCVCTCAQKCICN